MADPRLAFGTNFQPNRPPGPQPVPNPGFPTNQQHAAPGMPPKMGMPQGPPGQFSGGPQPPLPPMTGAPSGPPFSGMPPPLHGNMPPQGGPRPPVNGFSSPPSMQPPGSGVTRTPGPPSGMMGSAASSAGPGNVNVSSPQIRGPFNPQVSQTGQMLNGPTSQTTVNGYQSVQGGLPPSSQGQQYTGPPIQPGGPPMGGPAPNFRPPGPPTHGGPPLQGPPSVRPPGPSLPPVSAGQGHPSMRPSGPGQPPPIVSAGQGPPTIRPPGPGQPPPVVSAGQGPPTMRPPGPGQPPPNVSAGQGPPTMRPPGLGQPPPTVLGSQGMGAPPGSGPPLRPPGPPGPPLPQGQHTSRPNELPVPYHGHGQYSHQVGPTMNLTPGLTPGSGNHGIEPASQKSSRAPSPIANQIYDDMEGQFAPSPQGMTPVSSPPGSAAPPSQDMSRTTGITGRRQYPQMPSNSMPAPQGQQGYQGPPQGYQPTGAPAYQPSSTQGYQPTGAPAYQPSSTQGYQPTGAPAYQPSSTQGYQPTGAPAYQPGTAPGYQPTSTQGYQPSSTTGYQPSSTQGYQPGGAPQYQAPSLSQGYQGPPQPGYSQMPGGQPAPGPMSGPAGGYQPGGGSSNPNDILSNFSNMGVDDSQRFLNLMQERRLIPTDGLETVKPGFQHDFKKVNCNPDIFRCTLNAIPQTSSLLNKARLPLGIIIHPFKDLSQLPVIQSSVIVRCRSCRTYINPFVHFVDQRRWKCNLCYRVNDLPDEFSFDPVSKTYGDPQRRPEVKSATIEFIAPSEYMLRPPQPAVYVFLLDVSFNAIETGYLQLFCQVLLDELDKVPGDTRTQIAFLAYDRFLYFFGLAEGQSQPQMMVVPDLEDIFLPCPDNLLVNLSESKDLVIDLLNQLPTLFQDNRETGSALGAALQASFKLASGSGGRVTVMQTVLPTVGPGALQAREMPSNVSAKNVPHLGPATDFYKKLALDCSAQQISVDLFLLNGQYADLATLTCVSKYSAGCVYYYPSFHTLKTPGLVDRFDADFRRYLTRKIGFEAVMRIRCTRGLSIHTFHGNFFVRSTDLLSLPNINPDAGFGMQMSIEDNLTDTSSVCFQAALLYTSSKGERRIRVHTLCLPVTNQLSDVYAGADQQGIICLLAKMAVDRSVSSSMGDARDALINAALDCLLSYRQQVPASQRMGALPLPFTLRILPLYILAMLKSSAFRSATNVKLDDRVFSLLQCKTLPLMYLMQSFYPHLYPVHSIEERTTMTRGGLVIPKPPLLQLSSANIDRHGAYLMDVGNDLYLMVGGAISDQFCQDILDKPNFMSIPEGMNDLPETENPSSERLRNFINYLMDSRPYGASFLVLREDSKNRQLFFQHMVEDKTESSMSYYEFLQYLQQRTKS
ncbi:protein transport protein Sec24A-like isoform X3 [Haliotis rufescens]|uniref:protein transport protein Sec24A-like isoform X3 n=1 Tax=Haliotis rufescens TaxID=6454 RepID=UPI00201F8367|nr:protein transport protein Sec24A-like isoform X3 [Haliotis rufescens]